MNEHLDKNCAPIAEELSAYIDGELGSEERRTVETHLGSCATCRALLEELRGVAAVLGALPSLSAPEGLADRVMAEARGPDAGTSTPPATERVTPAPRWVRWGSMSVAASFLVLLTLHLGGLIGGPRRVDLSDLVARGPGKAASSAAPGAPSSEGAGAGLASASPSTFVDEPMERELRKMSDSLDRTEEGLARTREALALARKNFQKQFGGLQRRGDRQARRLTTRGLAQDPESLKDETLELENDLGPSVTQPPPAQAVYLSYSFDQQAAVDVLLHAQQSLSLGRAVAGPGSAEILAGGKIGGAPETGENRRSGETEAPEAPEKPRAKSGILAVLEDARNEPAVPKLPPVEAYAWSAAEELGAPVLAEGAQKIDLVLTQSGADSLLGILEAMKDLDVQTYAIAPPEGWGAISAGGGGAVGDEATDEDGKSDAYLRERRPRAEGDARAEAEADNENPPRPVDEENGADDDTGEAILKKARARRDVYRAGQADRAGQAGRAGKRDAEGDADDEDGRLLGAEKKTQDHRERRQTLLRIRIKQ